MTEQRLTLHQRLLWLLMAGLSLTPWLLWAQEPSATPQVKIERSGDNFQVEVEATVAVDIMTAWQVLTDYNHIAEFVPGMESSRIISSFGAPLRIEQKGETGWLFFARDFDVVLDIEELPLGLLKFHSAGGNMKRMEGEWRILETGPASITLHYSAEIVPEFWVPPLIGKALMSRNIRKNIEAVIAEMQKRHSAVHAVGSATRDLSTDVPRDKSTP